MSIERDTVTPLVDASMELTDALMSAAIALAWTEAGTGPHQAILDRGGRIRRAVERLQQAMLDHERATLARAP